MLKINKRLIALLLSVATILGGFAFPLTANAAEVSTTEEQTIVELQAVNPTVTEQEDGFLVRVDLVEQTNERLYVPVGIAEFDITINSSNTGGTCNWDVTLSNGDLIKGVYGNFVIKQDLFGPYNPVYADVDVKVTYSTNALYSVAHGARSFAFGAYEKLDEDENIIFQWRDFSVSGVKNTYKITNGEKQGEIGDFK